MGKNKTIYFTDVEEKFINKYLNDFPTWLHDKINEEMEKIPEFCQQKIEHYEKEITHWEKQKEEANKERESNRENFKLLKSEYQKIEPGYRTGFLNGAKGKRMLSKAGITKNVFLEKIKVLEVN